MHSAKTFRMMITDAEEHPSGPDTPFFSVLISGGLCGEGSSREVDAICPDFAVQASPGRAGRTDGDIRKRLHGHFVAKPILV